MLFAVLHSWQTSVLRLVRTTGMSIAVRTCTLFINHHSEIHVWTLEGDLVYSLSGHTSFIYGLSVLPNGDIVSCGEDRTVRVWRGASFSFVS
jgi:WD40 repeat protein